MTKTEMKTIRKLRGNGLGYKKIAQLVGHKLSTVKSFCRRHGLTGEVRVANADKEGHVYCRNCGVEIIQVKGRKKKKFCSDHCRNAWWNVHPELVERKAYYEVVCQHCGKIVAKYGRKGKYCSHKCYIEHRFGNLPANERAGQLNLLGLIE